MWFNQVSNFTVVETIRKRFDGFTVVAGARGLTFKNFASAKDFKEI